jgi:hypothetical protein
MKQTPQAFIHYYRPPSQPQATGAPVNPALAGPARQSRIPERIQTQVGRLQVCTLIFAGLLLLGYGFNWVCTSTDNWYNNWVKSSEAAREAQVGRELEEERLHPAPQPTPQPTPQWVVGTQYWVKMPDGRTILINFKGWVDHACNLPRQPAGGANNAMYIESATGTSWVWTIPASGSNVPRWIDP